MKKLELKFKNAEDRVVTYALEQPKEPVDAEAVKEAMDEILSQNVFESTGGELVAIHAAQLVDHKVTGIDFE